MKLIGSNFILGQLNFEQISFLDQQSRQLSPTYFQYQFSIKNSCLFFSYPVNTCVSIFNLGYYYNTSNSNRRFACQDTNMCSPQIRYCTYSNDWDHNYGIWVDFNGGDDKASD
jgi:hypothetical protein